MNGREFVRRARRYARANGLDFYFDPAWGKGSHGRVFIEERYTTVPHGEISAGLLRSMQRDLDIDRGRF
jgi:mRNA interferase HicA